jgi:hypothetical protein
MNVKPWPQRLIVVALLIGVCALATTAAAEIASLLGADRDRYSCRADRGV